MLLIVFLFAIVHFNQLIPIEQGHQIKRFKDGFKVINVYRDLQEKNAYKVICVPKDNLKYNADVKKELKLMDLFKHPNIIRGDYPVMYPLPYMLNGKGYILDCHQIRMDYYPFDLLEFVERMYKAYYRPNDGLWIALYEGTMRNAMRQILKGLFAIHLSGRAHLDLKFENILVRRTGKEWRCVIADLENMTNDTLVDGRITIAGTLDYFPPEMRYKLHYNPQMADMFQLGACLGLHMLHYSKLFTGSLLNSEYVFYKEIYFDFYFENLILDPQMIDFVRQLTRVNPKNRLTAEMALNHPWITGIPIQSKL
eukprot:NODE_173_length_14219_cov_0.603824.p6 type:complete len:310 gc:universal NODE_173_length_14219_cov_0.603824:13627-12698(-)